MKTELRSVLLLALLISLSPNADVLAQFTCATNAGALTITAYSGPGGPVSIPDSINGLPVTAIADQAFGYNTNVTSFTIGTNVTLIGDGAFAGCAALIAITINSNNPAYSGIGGVFFDKSQATLIQYPAADPAVSYAPPNGVLAISPTAFLGCASLTNVTMPNGLTSIGSNAFFRCTALVAVSLPATLTTIGDEAFGFCASLRNATIPNGVSGIGNSAFYACSNLASVSIGTGVTNLGDYAFFDCASLGTVTIPAALAAIGNQAFSLCLSLTAITVNSNNLVYSSLAGVLFDKAQATLLQYPEARPGSFYAVPNGVTSIALNAFQGCAALTSVSLPNGLAQIGDSAFFTCAGLTNVALGAGLMTIGSEAFFECGNLPSITIPSGVTNIGDSAFYGCGALLNVTIPDTVVWIGNYAFESCASLGKLALGTNLTGIGTSAFRSCDSLTNVIIPDSVASIGEYAFADCSRLQGLFFQGASPAADYTTFLDDDATAYYLPGTSGWGALFGGLPTVLWNPQAVDNGANFGLRANAFGFTIIGTTNIPIVVEAAASVVNPDWMPLLACTLTNGSIYFSDPGWTSFPTRFYRITAP